MKDSNPHASQGSNSGAADEGVMRKHLSLSDCFGVQIPRVTVSRMSVSAKAPGYRQKYRQTARKIL
jgi:hypothetical protein